MSNYRFDPEIQSQSFTQDDIISKHLNNALAYQKDVEYMKGLYSSTIGMIQKEIDDTCDQLEYSGSVMFDEYPDKNHLRMIVDQIMIRLTTEDDEKGEVQGASLECDYPRYCEDDALADCEDNDFLEATALDLPGGGAVKDHPGSFWHGGRPWGPGPWGPPPPPGPWGPPPPPPGPGPWGPPPPPPGPCFGPFCPIVNRPCGRGRWCSPVPIGDFYSDGSPNWMRFLVSNMLTNEMTYRRSRYRNHNR